VGAARARRSGASGGGVRSGEDKVEKGVSWPSTFCVRVHTLVKSILFSFFIKQILFFFRNAIVRASDRPDAMLLRPMHY
jgi:hypothetical protein